MFLAQVETPIVRRLRGTYLWSFFALAVYFAAAGMGVVDMARFGPDDHMHNGQPCQVVHFLKQVSSSDMPVVATVVVPVEFGIVTYEQHPVILRAAETVAPNSRDPPFTHFS